jgi:fluoride exporter
MLKWILVAVGGAFGSVLRYAMQAWLPNQVAGRFFPLNTMCVNLLGCLILGLLSGFFASPHLVREEYKVGLTVGVLGGFTTFSTFGLETFRLTEDRQFVLAALNMLISCGVGLAAVWFGYRVAQRWFGV